jgi:hypothetical protein
MAANDARSAADQPEETTPLTTTVSTNLDDLGTRAADLSADRYADLEREQRKERFDRAIARDRQ